MRLNFWVAQERMERKLDAITALLNQLVKENTQMALDITALQTAVANETTVEKSAITLIGGLAAQIQTLIDESQDEVDPAALQALVDQMTASQTALATAVTANTPAAPPAAPAA